MNCRLLASSVALTIVLAGPACAATTVYEYRIQHPTFGTIGTFTNTIEQNGGTIDVETVLHVAVRILGITLFRQDATRREEWRNGRLILFHGVTRTNGKNVEITGRAEGDRFAITTPQGVTLAPADVETSNPWVAGMLTHSDLMMSTKTGLVDHVSVTSGQETMMTVEDTLERVREYVIQGRKRDVVWLDDHRVPVAFRIVEHGTPIECVLTKIVTAPNLMVNASSPLGLHGKTIVNRTRTRGFP